MPAIEPEGLIVVKVADPDLGAALLADLRSEGLCVGTQLPDDPALACVLIADAPCAPSVAGRQLPGDAGSALAAALPSRGGAPPALVLVAVDTEPGARDALLRAGADEVVFWPQGRQGFAVRMRALLRRRRLDLDCHPLTGLPGARALQQHLRSFGPADELPTVIAFDLRQFKAYNDHYGFARGNDVICFVARLLTSAADPEAKVYHIGGDDFIVVTTAGSGEGIVRRAVEMFSTAVADLYDPDDRQRGYIVGRSRETGRPARYGIMGLSVICVDGTTAATGSIEALADTIVRLRGSPSEA